MITVLFFASAKEAAGVSSRTFDVSVPMSVGQFAEMLSREFPPLHALMPSIRFAVNRTITDSSGMISDGDEIAVLPP
ncbi:MAG TPA: MoaD/ThiS family protein, partial [Bacteroidota bacterium]|nr:MoaD/ThiS family protein [Bacteroidota bacterium]